ncbi:MAG: hypothetical protein RR840_08555, partial [Clostridium sp.]
SATAIIGSVVDSALSRSKATVDVSNARDFANIITSKLNSRHIKECELPKGKAVRLDDATALRVLGYRAPKVSLNKGEDFYVVNNTLTGKVVIAVSSSAPNVNKGDNSVSGQIYPAVNNSDYLGYVSSAIE